MLKARHHWFYVKFFNWFLHYKMQKHFHEIVIKGTLENKNIPSLMMGNHISWWDGFIAQYLNLKFLHKKIFIMMMEEELQKRQFFCRTGAFSIGMKKSAIIESLNYAASVIQHPENLLLMYPQGLIQSQHRQVISFHSGISRILKSASYPLQICYYVAFTDYFSNPKPTLFLYVNQEILNQAASAKELETQYHLFLTNCLQQQNQLP